ncbi:MAG: 50S ribosomal protein L18 [Armatimonadetes bacterium]|nr:50S ribosomal protein L18 [Armatimonadota bacterium]
MATRSSKASRSMRHARIRKRVEGSADRPRLAVFRSLKQISVQLIDDSQGVTVASASSLEKALDSKVGGNRKGAENVGQLIAERAKEKGIAKVVFDRGGFRYAGRVAVLADAARKAGLEF